MGRIKDGLQTTLATRLSTANQYAKPALLCMWDHSCHYWRASPWELVTTAAHVGEAGVLTTPAEGQWTTSSPQ